MTPLGSATKPTTSRPYSHIQILQRPSTEEDTKGQNRSRGEPVFKKTSLSEDAEKNMENAEKSTTRDSIANMPSGTTFAAKARAAELNAARSRRAARSSSFDDEVPELAPISLGALKFTKRNRGRGWKPSTLEGLSTGQPPNKHQSNLQPSQSNQSASPRSSLESEYIQSANSKRATTPSEIIEARQLRQASLSGYQYDQTAIQNPQPLTPASQFNYNIDEWDPNMPRAKHQGLEPLYRNDYGQGASQQPSYVSSVPSHASTPHGLHANPSTTSEHKEAPAGERERTRLMIEQSPLPDLNSSPHPATSAGGVENQSPRHLAQLNAPEWSKASNIGDRQPSKNSAASTMPYNLQAMEDPFNDYPSALAPIHSNSSYDPQHAYASRAAVKVPPPAVKGTQPHNQLRGTLNRDFSFPQDYQSQFQNLSIQDPSQMRLQGQVQGAAQGQAYGHNQAHSYRQAQNQGYGQTHNQAYVYGQDQFYGHPQDQTDYVKTRYDKKQPAVTAATSYVRDPMPYTGFTNTSSKRDLLLQNLNEVVESSKAQGDLPSSTRTVLYDPVGRDSSNNGSSTVTQSTLKPQARSYPCSSDQSAARATPESDPDMLKASDLLPTDQHQEGNSTTPQPAPATADITDWSGHRAPPAFPPGLYDDCLAYNSGNEFIESMIGSAPRGAEQLSQEAAAAFFNTKRSVAEEDIREKLLRKAGLTKLPDLPFQASDPWQPPIAFGRQKNAQPAPIGSERSAAQAAKEKEQRDAVDIFAPVIANLQSHKTRDYFSRYADPPAWCVDNSAEGNKSFFEKGAWGNPPPRVGRDPRYRTTLHEGRPTYFEDPQTGGRRESGGRGASGGEWGRR